MSLSEFELIRRYFSRSGMTRPDVILGMGDDCALLHVPAGMELAVSIDILVEGRHFPVGTDARAVGHKALAVGLSDLAAMGATPAWVTLALSLPDVDECWLDGFAAGLFALADEYGMQLVGGDTVRGPRVITLQVHGLVPQGQAMQRGRAREGDRIYVSGTPGDAGLGLAIVEERLVAEPALSAVLRQRLDYPRPRIPLGKALRGLASAAIDISDGLAADLQHILDCSGVGAVVELANLPRSAAMRQVFGNPADCWPYILTAGDDYELCFTVPPGQVPAVEELCATLDCPCTCIGRIESGHKLQLLQPDGRPWIQSVSGFDHFMRN